MKWERRWKLSLLNFIKAFAVICLMAFFCATVPATWATENPDQNDRAVWYQSDDPTDKQLSEVGTILKTVNLNDSLIAVDATNMMSSTLTIIVVNVAEVYFAKRMLSTRALMTAQSSFIENGENFESRRIGSQNIVRCTIKAKYQAGLVYIDNALT